MNEVLEKWSTTRLLDGLDEHRKTPMAECLESQYILNIEENNVWKRVSLPLIRRIFSKTNNIFKFNEGGDFKILQFKTKFPSTQFGDNLASDVDLCFMLEQSLTKEINDYFKETKKVIGFSGLKSTNGVIYMFYKEADGKDE